MINFSNAYTNNIFLSLSRMIVNSPDDKTFDVEHFVDEFIELNGLHIGISDCYYLDYDSEFDGLCLFDEVEKCELETLFLDFTGNLDSDISYYK